MEAPAPSRQARRSAGCLTFTQRHHRARRARAHASIWRSSSYAYHQMRGGFFADHAWQPGTVSANHVEAAALVACGLFSCAGSARAADSGVSFRDRPGPRVPSQWRMWQPQVRKPAMEPAEVVVVMQHPLTTFSGKAITLKKSADAYVFCFPVGAGHSRLARLKKLQCSRPLSLGAGKSG
jgi:hypothetical protein